MNTLQDAKNLLFQLTWGSLEITKLEESLALTTHMLKVATERRQALLEVENPQLCEDDEEEMRTFKVNLKLIELVRIHHFAGFDVGDYFMKHGFVSPKQAQVLVKTLWRCGGESIPATKYPKVHGTRKDFDSLKPDVRNFLAPVSSVSGEPLLHNRD